MTPIPPNRRKACLIASLGPAHDRPWWWRHLAADRHLCNLEYERLVYKGLRCRDIRTADLPAVFLMILRRLRSWERDYDYVFTFECDLLGFGIAWWQSLLGRRRPRHVILQFIMREKQATLASRLKYLLMRFMFSSVHRIIVSSSAELAYYRDVFRWPSGKLAFVPMHTAPEFLEREPLRAGNFVLAAGRSFRDYGTLAEAIRGTDIETVIVGGTGTAALFAGIGNATVLEEIPEAELEDLMLAARAVVVPLQKRSISAGQIVVLQAMALGKLVIATETAGTADYIRHMHTGILVPVGDAAALRAALASSEDAGSRERIGAAARAEVAARLLPHHYSTNVRAAIWDGADPAAMSVGS